MQISLRSQMVAGVATVGAAAMVVAPIAQPDLLPSMQRVSSAVSLTAFENPIAALAYTAYWAIGDSILSQAELLDPAELYWPDSYYTPDFSFLFAPGYSGLIPDFVNQVSFGGLSAVVSNLAGYGNAADFYSPTISGVEAQVRETSASGALTGLRSAALPITGGVATQFGAIYVLISHGVNSLGARTRTGTQIATTGIPANESENTDTANLIFVSRPLASTTSATPFDDIVRFGNKAMFGEGAMYKTPYMKIRYAERSFRRATNYLAANTPAGSANIAGYNDGPVTAPGTAVETGAHAAARILVNLWATTNAAPLDETWRCVDNLLYLSSTAGVPASSTQAPSTYGASTGANYRYTKPHATYANEISCACPNGRSQHFDLANTAIPLGACR